MRPRGRLDRPADSRWPRGRALAFSSGAAGLVLAVASRAGAAHPGPCVRVQVEGPATPQWQTAVEALRARLAQLAPSECTPMDLALVLGDAADSARIVATTGDGRRTERRVKHPDALVATALGLTAGIPPEPAATATAPPPAGPAATEGAIRTTASTEPAAPTATGGSTAAIADSLGLWMGLSAGIRLAAPTGAAAVDLEGRGDLRVGSWLVLATVRSALVSCLGNQGLDCDAYTDVGGGIGVGRLFDLGPATVDFAFEPLVLAMHMEIDADGEGTASEQTEVALFLDASARLRVPLGRRWALSLEVDGALAPSVLASPIQLAPPASEELKALSFPAWMGGVRVGATGAIL